MLKHSFGMSACALCDTGIGYEQSYLQAPDKKRRCHYQPPVEGAKVSAVAVAAAVAAAPVAVAAVAAGAVAVEVED